MDKKCEKCIHMILSMQLPSKIITDKYYCDEVQAYLPKQGTCDD